MKCACGKPLHYTNQRIRSEVEELVARLGPDIVVLCAGKRYSVSRHYIALHGLKGWELETLAVQGVVKCLSPRSQPHDLHDR